MIEISQKNRSRHQNLYEKLKAKFPFYESKENAVLKFAYATKEGYSPKKPSKPNQDTFIIAPNVHKGFHLFGVADGHGEFGHIISAYIKAKMPQMICKAIDREENDIEKLLTESFL